VLFGRYAADPEVSRYPCRKAHDDQVCQNRAYRSSVAKLAFPYKYLFYQTLVGTWSQSPITPSEHETFVGRIRDYMLKAAKEAKLYTSWISPNRHYERHWPNSFSALWRHAPATIFSPTSQLSRAHCDGRDA
jgi:maltooligosyltrehalose synthase